MNWQISKLMISLILVSLIAGTIGIFMSGLSKEYNVEYDNSSVTTFNMLSNITETTQSVQNRTASAERDSSGVVDALSGFFSDAYQALLITTQSYTVIESMLDHALSEADLGSVGSLFKTAILTIVIIVIFIGIIIAAIIKRDA